MNKIDKFLGHENPNTFFRPAVRSFLVSPGIMIGRRVAVMHDGVCPGIMIGRRVAVMHDGG